MIIADTSVWIEFLKKNSDYFQIFTDLLEENKIIALECIFGELLQGAKNEKEIEILSNYWANLPKINEYNIIIKAGILSSRNKLFVKGIGLIDSIIAVCCIKNNYRLWSLDKKLNSIFRKVELFEV